MEAATWVRGELLYQRDADAIRVASRPGALRYHVTHLPNRALRLRPAACLPEPSVDVVHAGERMDSCQCTTDFDPDVE